MTSYLDFMVLGMYSGVIVVLLLIAGRVAR